MGSRLCALDGGEVGWRDVRGHLRRYCVEPCFNFAHPHIFNMVPLWHWTWVRHPLAVGLCILAVGEASTSGGAEFGVERVAAAARWGEVGRDVLQVPNWRLRPPVQANLHKGGSAQ